MSRRTCLIAAALLAAIATLNFRGAALAQLPKPVRVNVDNFARAETDTYFTRFVKDGAFGKFRHDRELAPIDRQTVIRMNRDTLYSFAVFDLDAGPVTIFLPETDKRFMAMMIVNEDHYVPEVVYKPGPHVVTREKVGTRYVGIAIRTFVNPGDATDVSIVHGLQDAIGVEQKAQGQFEVPAWDEASHKKIRDALLALASANGGLDSSRMFGRKDQVDPVQHLIGTAAGWGGNPRQDALYAGGDPTDNNGRTAYRLTLRDVPVDGFWSVSVYNKEGFFEKNPKNLYTLNNVTAKPNADGSVTIHFGGDEKSPNFLPIMPGWNYLIRLYRPRKEILDGTWKIPEPEAVK